MIEKEDLVNVRRYCKDKFFKIILTAIQEKKIKGTVRKGKLYVLKSDIEKIFFSEHQKEEAIKKAKEMLEIEKGYILFSGLLSMTRKEISGNFKERLIIKYITDNRKNNYPDCDSKLGERFKYKYPEILSLIEGGKSVKVSFVALSNEVGRLIYPKRFKIMK